MTSMRTVLLLTMADLGYRLLSRRGLIFLIPFGLFWYWVLDTLADGGARWLQRPEAGALASWLLDPETAFTLLREHPPTLSAFYYLALSTMPLFMILVGANQTSSDRASRYFRLLLPRAMRLELYLARLFSVSILASLAFLMVWMISLLLSLGVDNVDREAVLGFAMSLLPAVLLYAVSYCALMALVSSYVSSAAGSALLGISAYAVLLMLFAYLRDNWPQTAPVEYLLPGSQKVQLLAFGSEGWLLSLASLPVYILVYTWLGWRVFRGREL